MSEHEHDPPPQGAGKKPFLKRYQAGKRSAERAQAAYDLWNQPSSTPSSTPSPPPSPPGPDVLQRIEEKLNQVIDMLGQLLEKQGQKGE